MVKTNLARSSSGIYSRKIWWDHIIANYDRIIPELFSYEHLPNATNITKIITQKYVGEKPLHDAFEEISKVSRYLYLPRLNKSLKIYSNMHLDVWILYSTIR